MHSTSTSKNATSRNKKNKGLAMGFASRQRETIDASGQQLNDRLAALQRGQEELEREREELDSLRQQLASTPQAAPSSPGMTLLPLADLRLSGDTQSRVHLDPSIVSEYMERMIADDAEGGPVRDPEGNVWEPIKVYREANEEGSHLWVADGFHRASAARELGLTRFQCVVLDGTQRDAVRESLSANARHGLRRTRADKRRAVERALLDAEWRVWTDQRLADLCAVSRSMVSRTREELERSRAIPFEIALYGADGREFEREEPPVEATMTTSTEAVGEVEAPPHREVVAREVTRRVSSCSWKKAPGELAKAKKYQTFIAYPEVEAHYAILRDALLLEERAPSRLLLPLLDGSEWFWRGPSILHALIEQGLYAQPVVVFMEEHKKHFVCWNHRDVKAPLPSGTTRLTQLRGEDALILGTSLDAW